jgi:DNA invertase Pin-like site-specific DNA recombinase
MNTSNVKVGIFVRCSSSSQTVTSQKLPLIEYCERNNQIIVDTYEDVAISGVAKIKPARERMLNDIKRGRINKVVVFSVCRISRNTCDFIKFIEELQENKCELYVHTAQLDTATVFGRTMLQFVALMGSWEREMLKSRISEGINNRRKLGLSIGRPTVVNNGIIEAIKLLHHQGVGAREIMRRLQVGTKIYYKTIRSMNDDERLVA